MPSRQPSLTDMQGKRRWVQAVQEAGQPTGRGREAELVAPVAQVRAAERAGPGGSRAAAQARLQERQDPVRKPVPHWLRGGGLEASLVAAPRVGAACKARAATGSGDGADPPQTNPTDRGWRKEVNVSWA